MDRKMITLKMVVKHIASQVEPKDQRRALILSPENMIAWREIFTDPAVHSGSYEPYEIMGDKVANKLVVARGFKLHPNLNEHQVTNLVAHYGSNAVFAEIMKNYTVPVNITGKGMVPKNIVSYFMFLPDKSVGAKLTDSIYADMFEAIMGGLYMIGDSILDGLGDIYCRRWFNHIYVSRYPEFEASAFEGNAKSIVETLFSRFAFYIKGSKTQPAVSYESIDVDDKKKVGVRSVKGWYELGPNLITFLKNYARTSGEKKVANIAKYEAEITMNEGGQAPDVKLEASVRLLRWLKEECGIDVAWAERVKSELDAKELQKDPELSNMYEIIRNYLRKLGLSSNFYFKTLAKHSPAGKSVGIQIQTADKEGNDRVLFTRIYEVGLVYEARKLIVKDFAEEIESKR